MRPVLARLLRRLAHRLDPAPRPTATDYSRPCWYAQGPGTDTITPAIMTPDEARDYIRGRFS